LVQVQRNIELALGLFALLFPVGSLVLGLMAFDLKLLVVVFPLSDFTFEVENLILQVTHFVFKRVHVAVQLVNVSTHLDLEGDRELPLFDHLGFTLVVKLGLSL
jgi:hypothetical protein